MTTITITKRSDDYHTCLNSDQALWGRGKSISEAVGDVIRSHGQYFPEIRLQFGETKGETA